MHVNDVDANLKYLVLTLLILAVAAGYHNYTTNENDIMSFGMCDQSIQCHGISSSGYCIGVESPAVTCMSPEDAPEWRRAEVECGLDAQGLCNADPSLSGTDWTNDESAQWDDKRCTQWAQENEEFDLLTCEQTFNDISQWTTENQ